MTLHYRMKEALGPGPARDYQNAYLTHRCEGTPEPDERGLDPKLAADLRADADAFVKRMFPYLPVQDVAAFVLKERKRAA